MRLITSERAKRDIEEIARYIALDSSQSAEEFRKAVSNALSVCFILRKWAPIVVSTTPLSTTSV
jgi:hypothetical protein